MATVITIDWNDESPPRGTPYPDPAAVERNSCVIFVNKLNVDIEIKGERGLFKGNETVMVEKNGGINAIEVTGAVGAGKEYEFDDEVVAGADGVSTRQGTIDVG